VSAEDRAAPLNALGGEAAGDLAGRGALAGAVVGVGIDAVDIDRFRRVLGRRAHLAARVFTDGERAYARAAADPVPRMSTRFAAKEATMKALGVGLGAFPFADVEVVRIDLDAPTVVLHGSARALADGAGVVRWHLSLSHTEQVAMAVVVAEGVAPAEPVGGRRLAAVLPARP
jgi:holo-[acyl-carrier protein] synthase